MVSSIQIVSFCQSDGPREVTPPIEKKIRQDIKKEVIKLRQKMKSSKENDLSIEFAVDTSRVEKYMEKYMEYDYSTVGMVDASYSAAHQYDSLLNKYYKKLLSVLNQSDKQVLIKAQKAWINFRDTESKLIDTMSKEEYSGGGTVQGIIDASSYLKLIKNRVIAILEHLERAQSIE
jgi:uncharacterized protein YecT (DUF1311 family)